MSSPGHVAVGITRPTIHEMLLKLWFATMSSGLFTIAITGDIGGQMRGLMDVLINVPEETPRIQECHIVAGHALCDVVEGAIVTRP